MKKIRIPIIYIKFGTIYILIIILIAALAIFSQESMSAAKNALLLCANNIIPALFPFFILSGILINTGFAKVAGRLLAPIMRPVFNIDGAGGVAFALGIISGYPMGAKIVCDLFKRGSINLTESKRLLPFCNNSGPLFIIGAVGAGMLGNIKVGIFLYVLHAFSALIVGVIFRFYKGRENQSTVAYNRTARKTEAQENKRKMKADTLADKTDAKKSQRFGATLNMGVIFSESVKNAVNTTLLVCGYVVFFAAASAPILNVLSRCGGPLKAIINSILEVTGGVGAISELDMPPNLKIALCAGALGFGGLCVCMQVQGIVADTPLGIRTYVLGKLSQGAISSLAAYILLKNTYLPVFLNNSVPLKSSAITINFDLRSITAVFVICAAGIMITAIRKKIY